MISLAGIDPDDIHMELLKDITIGCKVPKPNIIILEPGEAPNSNKDIEKVCFTYFDDLNITNEDNNKLDIWADQAIYQHLTQIKDEAGRSDHENNEQDNQ